MGRLFDLIQEHMDQQRYGVSERQVARELGVSPTTLRNWRTPRGMIEREHLEAIARVTRNPYTVVRNAWLEDVGLLRPGRQEGPADDAETG